MCPVIICGWSHGWCPVLPPMHLSCWYCKTYGSYFSAYNRFFVLLGIALVLALTGTLWMYTTFFTCFLLPESLCLCVDFVGLLHKKLDLPNPLANNWLISSIIREICWVYGTPVKSCLPITIGILLGIRSHLNLLNRRHALFWAICLVSLFGLFHKAHVSVSGPMFNHTQQFTSYDFGNTKYGCSILVRWSTITVLLMRLSNSFLCAQFKLSLMLSSLHHELVVTDRHSVIKGDVA